MTVDARRRLAELARQHRARVRELVVAQDPARDRLALDPLHDVARADAVAGLEHVDDLRHRHAGGAGQDLELRLVLLVKRPPGRAPGERRRITRAARRAATTSNDQLSCDAPPESNRSPSMPRAPGMRGCSARKGAIRARPRPEAGLCRCSIPPSPRLSV